VSGTLGGRRGVTWSAGLLGLAVVIAALAVLLVAEWVLDGSSSTAEGRAFIATPQFILWLLILAVQAVVWLGGAAFVFITFRRRRRDLRRRRVLPWRAVALLAASALVLLIIAAYLLFATRLDLAEGVAASRLPKEWPLPDHERKVVPLVVIAAVIGFSAIVAMWLTTLAFLDLARRARPSARSVRRFLALHSELTALLAFTGMLVGLATLSSGALREAVLAANDQPTYQERTLTCLTDETGKTAAEVRTESDALLEAYPECRQLEFDRSYVLAYGLFFTGILAIAFAPSFMAMRMAARRLRDRAFPLPNPGASDFFDVVEHRRSFDDLLETNLSATATFKAGAAIVTPLVASLLSTLLPS
jgi:hypothetical protein